MKKELQPLLRKFLLNQSFLYNYFWNSNYWWFYSWDERRNEYWDTDLRTVLLKTNNITKTKFKYINEDKDYEIIDVKSQQHSDNKELTKRLNNYWIWDLSKLWDYWKLYVKFLRNDDNDFRCKLYRIRFFQWKLDRLDWWSIFQVYTYRTPNLDKKEEYAKKYIFENLYLFCFLFWNIFLNKWVIKILNWNYNQFSTERKWKIYNMSFLDQLFSKTFAFYEIIQKLDKLEKKGEKIDDIISNNLVLFIWMEIFFFFYLNVWIRWSKEFFDNKNLNKRFLKKSWLENLAPFLWRELNSYSNQINVVHNSWELWQKLSQHNCVTSWLWIAYYITDKKLQKDFIDLTFSLIPKNLLLQKDYYHEFDYYNDFDLDDIFIPDE